MTKQTAVNLDISNNLDGFDIAGGTTVRKLSLSGADIALIGAGSEEYTFPVSTDTLAGLGTAQTWTETNTFEHLFPSANATYDLGDDATPLRWRHLYLTGNISDGTNVLTVANAKTAYDYSQVGHLPLAGGTMSGDIDMGTNNIWNARIIGDGPNNLDSNSAISLGTGFLSFLAAGQAIATWNALGDTPGEFPGVDNTYSLGENDTPYRWKDLFLAGNLSDGTNSLTVANAKTAYDYSRVGHLPLAGGTLSGNLIMGDNSITGIDTLTFTDTAGTVAGIENGNLVDKSAAETIEQLWTFTEVPTGTGVGAGSLYINPASATSNYTLLGLAVNGSAKFRIDEDGDLFFLDAATLSDVSANSVTIANLKTSFDHVTETGASHSYINQNVTTAGSPTFRKETISNGYNSAEQVFVTTAGIGATDDTDWIICGTGASSDTLFNGDYPWDDPTFIEAEAGAASWEADFDSEYSDALYAHNFGFDGGAQEVPADAIIIGIEVEVELEGDAGMEDSRAFLVDASGSELGTDQSQAESWEGVGSLIYGGSTNLWGTGGITAATVRDSDFGFYIVGEATEAAYGEVYWIKMKIYYAEPVGTTNTFTIGNATTDGSFRISDHTALGTNDRLIIDTVGTFNFQTPIVLPYLGAAPASVVNGMIWMESDGLHIYYGGVEKTVAGA